MSRMDEYLMAIITGENEDLPEPRSSTEREFYEAAKKGFGGSVSSWNDLTDKPFGETTVMGDTLTWDGDMTGKVYVELEYPVDDEGNTTPAYFVKVSNVVPTFEELQSGGTTIATQGGDAVTSEWGYDKDQYYIDMGTVMLDEALTLPIIVKEDNTDLTETLGMPLVFPKKGIYFINIPLAEMTITSFTINNYAGFEMEVVETIDPKYLPSGGNNNNRFIINVQIEDGAFVFDKTFAEISQAVNNGENIVIKYDVNTIVNYTYFDNMFKFQHVEVSSLDQFNLYIVTMTSENYIFVDMYSCNCTHTQIV